MLVVGARVRARFRDGVGVRARVKVQPRAGRLCGGDNVGVCVHLVRVRVRVGLVLGLESAVRLRVRVRVRGWG